MLRRAQELLSLVILLRVKASGRLPQLAQGKALRFQNEEGFREFFYALLRKDFRHAQMQGLLLLLWNSLLF